MANGSPAIYVGLLNEISTLIGLEPSISSEFYGLQDALRVNSTMGRGALLDANYIRNADRAPSLYVLKSACFVDGVQNCSAACSRPSLLQSLTGDMATLHNCVVMPQITAARSNFSAIDFLGIPEATGNSDTQTQLMELGMLQDYAVEVASDIASVLQSCLFAYCNQLPGCATDHVEAYLQSNTTDNLDNDLLSNLASDICGNIQASINVDVGGIGVYISYWIQTCLALTTFVLIVMGKLIVPIHHSGSQSSLGKNQQQLSPFRSAVREHLTRLIAALTDFHKAQCFFMMATNIAALVVLHRGGLDPQSVQQIYNTYYFLKMVAISGYLPITLTMFALHLVDMVSWYLLGLSVITMALSFVTLVTVGSFDPAVADLQALKTSALTGGPPSECSGIRPDVFCFVANDATTSGTFPSQDDADPNVDLSADNILAFCCSVMLFIIIMRSHIWKKKSARLRAAAMHRQLSDTWKSFRPSVQYMTRTFQESLLQPATHVWDVLKAYLACQEKSHWVAMVVKYWKLIFKTLRLDPLRLHCQRLFRACSVPGMPTRILFGIIHTLMTIFLTEAIAAYMMNLRWFKDNGAFNTTWNFGQVVAIIVWALPICEYAHLEFRGMTCGFGHKLLPPYRVTQTPSTYQFSTAEDHVTTVDEIPCSSDAEIPDLIKYDSKIGTSH